jgi:hypothetical protein
MENSQAASTLLHIRRFRWWAKPLLLLLIAVMILGAAAWWTRPPRDPVIKGQRLSWWMYHKLYLNEDLSLNSGEVLSAGPDAIKRLMWAAEHGHQAKSKGRTAPPKSTFAQWVDARWRRWFHVGYDDEYDERYAALSFLLSMTPDAAPAVPVLERVLCNSAESEPIDAGRKRYAAQTLVWIGPPAWPAIEDIFRTGGGDVRLLLVKNVFDPIFALKNYPPELAALKRPSQEEFDWAFAFMVKASADRNLSIRSAAASELAKMRERPEGARLAAVAVPAMVDLLSDADPVVRGIALDFFEASGPEARAVSPQLRELVDDEDATVRAKAIRTVGKIHGVDRREVDRLQALAADPNADVRKEVKALLERLTGSGG